MEWPGVAVAVAVAGPKVLPSDQRQSNYPGNWEQEATGRAAVTFTKMTNRTLRPTNTGCTGCV